MVAVAVAVVFRLDSGIKPPVFDQLLVFYGIGAGGQSGVIASDGDGVGPDPVEIGDRAEITLAAVAVVVAPECRAAALRPVIDGVERFAGQPVE